MSKDLLQIRLKHLLDNGICVKKLEWHLLVTNFMNLLTYFSHMKTNSFLSLFPPSQIPSPKNQIKIKIYLYLFKNNWLFMMINPNEWSKGSHFIRCYLKPKVSMAETLVIEAPWLHYKPAWPNLQELTHHRWWSSHIPLFLFSVYFSMYGWKSSTFVGWLWV